MPEFEAALPSLGAVDDFEGVAVADVVLPERRGQTAARLVANLGVVKIQVPRTATLVVAQRLTLRRERGMR
jgi:hypothetical protein